MELRLYSMRFLKLNVGNLSDLILEAQICSSQKYTLCSQKYTIFYNCLYLYAVIHHFSQTFALVLTRCGGL